MTTLWGCPCRSSVQAKRDEQLRGGHLGKVPGSCGDSQPSGPAEVQCEFFGTISGLNFGR